MKKVTPPLYVLNFTSNPPLSSCDFPLCPPLWFPNPPPPLQVIIAQSLMLKISFALVNGSVLVISSLPIKGVGSIGKCKAR